MAKNPCGTPSTSEFLNKYLDENGTIEQWTTKYGRKCGHDAIMMESVSRLLTEGVKQWTFKPTMEAVHRHYPVATPVTWWVLIHAENHTDKELFSKLASYTPGFHPYVWTEKTTRSWAVACLRAVRAKIEEEGMQWMNEQSAAYDAYASGAGRTDG